MPHLFRLFLPKLPSALSEDGASGDGAWKMALRDAKTVEDSFLLRKRRMALSADAPVPVPPKRKESQQ